MSEISLILVLHKKTNKTLNDMAKIQIKSEKLTPFGGFFSIMEQFDSKLSEQRRQHKRAFPPEGHAEQILLRGLTWRSSDSKQQAESRRLSSSLYLCQESGSGHQGSMCWISIIRKLSDINNKKHVVFVVYIRQIYYLCTQHFYIYELSHQITL